MIQTPTCDAVGTDEHRRDAGSGSYADVVAYSRKMLVIWKERLCWIWWEKHLLTLKICQADLLVNRVKLLGLFS